jgi:hypothetical protein
MVYIAQCDAKYMFQDREEMMVCIDPKTMHVYD